MVPCTEGGVVEGEEDKDTDDDGNKDIEMTGFFVILGLISMMLTKMMMMITFVLVIEMMKMYSM